jgi:hypothetical protein
MVEDLAARFRVSHATMQKVMEAFV